MPLTPFGKEVRKYRIDRDMLLKDLADALGVTPTFVSAVEAGRKPVPPAWPERISDVLGLDMIQRKALENAAAKSAREVRISLAAGAGDLDRSVAAMLGRSFGELDDEQLRDISEILNRRKA